VYSYSREGCLYTPTPPCEIIPRAYTAYYSYRNRVSVHTHPSL
jgi:hypothetical protein